LPHFWADYVDYKNVELVSSGQRIWDKVKSCGEHIGEHIGNSMGTYWELVGNTMGTRKTPLTPPLYHKRKKKLGYLAACCLTSLAARMQECFGLATFLSFWA